MEFEQEKVLQDNPDLGATADSPPAQTVPEQEKEAPPENIPYNRFQEVVGKKNELQSSLEERDRQVEMLTQELLKTKQPVQQQAQPVQVELPTKPNRDEFDDDTDYFMAVSDYKYKANRFQEEQERQKNAVVESHQRNYQQHQLRAADFVSKNPDKGDYWAVAENNTITQYYPSEMKAAIVASGMSPQIAYHLGKNQAEAIRIANSPLPSLEIGKLEAKLSSPAPAKQVSMAPQAINPVGDTNAAHERVPGKDNMAYEEYKAKMNVREAQNRKNGTWGR